MGCVQLVQVWWISPDCYPHDIGLAFPATNCKPRILLAVQSQLTARGDSCVPYTIRFARRIFMLDMKTARLFLTRSLSSSKERTIAQKVKMDCTFPIFDFVT